MNRLIEILDDIPHPAFVGLLVLALLGFIVASVGITLFDEVPNQTRQGRYICEDGWVSPSSGPGTCSWHGGVRSPGTEWNPQWPPWPFKDEKPVPVDCSNPFLRGALDCYGVSR